MPQANNVTIVDHTDYTLKLINDFDNYVRRPSHPARQSQIPNPACVAVHMAITALTHAYVASAESTQKPLLAMAQNRFWRAASPAQYDAEVARDLLVLKKQYNLSTEPEHHFVSEVIGLALQNLGRPGQSLLARASSTMVDGFKLVTRHEMHALARASFYNAVPVSARSQASQPRAI